MRFLRRSLIGLFLIAATVGVLTIAGTTVYNAVQTRLADEGLSRPARERVFSVNVLPVTVTDISPELTVFGEIRSRRVLDLRASASGRVIELSDDFVEGGEVSAGQMLVRIDPADAEAALQVAQTDLAEAEAEQRDAERALDLAQQDVASAEEQARLREQALQRQIDIRERGYGSDAAVEEAELTAASARQSVVSRRQALATATSRIDTAKTSLARAEIAVQEATRDLADTEIRAAFTGALRDVSLVEGGLVSNNEQIAQLIDPDALEVEFRVSTAQYANLLDDRGTLIDGQVSVQLETFGIALSTTGRVTRESASVADGQVGRILYAQLDAAPGFRPGDFVTVRVQEPELTDVARLPASALGGDNTVLVVADDDRLELAPVTLLRRQGNDVIIRAGDLSGRLVVAERAPQLGAGIKINPLQQGQEQAAAKPDMMELTAERRAALIAFVEGSSAMPQAAKDRVLAQLNQDRVPSDMVERIESRMGG